jgi:hypothetical protein
MGTVRKKSALFAKICLKLFRKNYRIEVEIDTRLIDEAPDSNH